ncbi:major facilitator superfamily domain-containing protein [Rhodocollybia butyracea]|uniref:Major facilitator superfamily domain-containing protein n=1 Tax=Rhodocollybia butyracea TaxID=206335 RepID=A0A9P5P7C8_9AGAR|nr:major facilitator superfamily domain-containing protein [Rhodocollybia butyracea]
MLFTVIEESGEDDDHYDYPPPGNLETFYEVSQDAMVEASGSNLKNVKETMSEKHVEEVIVPAEEDNDWQRPEDQVSVQHSIDFPDGGLRAWMVVLGTSFSAFASFGFVNAWGVFQAYYEETLLKDHSPSTIAWIGSVQYALVLFPALFSGRLFDLGIFKLPFLAASILVVVCTILVGQCTHYWQFFLCQGVAVGIGSGMIFGPSMAIIGQWFRKRRGLALGITAFGSGVGGTIFPIAVQKLIPRVGFPWTMRILGFILLFALTIPNLTLARRLPPENVAGGWFNLSTFKNPPFFNICSCSINWLSGTRYHAVAVGVSPEMAFYLISIANASSAFGRIVAGFMTDRIGALNFLASTTLTAAVLSFMCGSFVCGFIVPVYALGDIGDVGRRTGMIMTVGAAGNGGFKAVGYYAGSVTAVSAILMLITRYLALRNSGQKTWKF